MCSLSLSLSSLSLCLSLLLGVDSISSQTHNDTHTHTHRSTGQLQRFDTAAVARLVLQHLGRNDALLSVPTCSLVTLSVIESAIREPAIATAIGVAHLPTTRLRDVSDGDDGLKIRLLADRLTTYIDNNISEMREISVGFRKLDIALEKRQEYVTLRMSKLPMMQSR